MGKLRWFRLKRLSQLKLSCFLFNQAGQAGHLVSTGDTVANVVKDIDAQFIGSCDQAQTGVPNLGTFFSSGAKADVLLGFLLASAQFSRIIVKGDLWVIQDRQQFNLFGFGPGNTLVKVLIAGDGGEELVKFISQMFSFSRGWVKLLSRQLVIKGPELGQELVKYLGVIFKGRVEFLVVTTFMHPTQGQYLRNSLELSGIVTQQ